MAQGEDGDDDRTESASPKKLEDARKQGNVARSRELTAIASLGSGFLATLIFGPGIFNAWIAQIQASMRSIANAKSGANAAGIMSEALMSSIYGCFMVSAPVIIACLAGALLSPLITRSWVFLLHLAAPKFSRLSPSNWYKKVFSLSGLFEIAKSFLKMILVGSCVWAAIASHVNEIPGLIASDARAGLIAGSDIVMLCVTAAMCALLTIVFADVPYQIWHHSKSLMMSKQELRDESKDSEGNPEIKARVRQLQRDSARKRMMSEIPKADVVITNPTHYAVAIAWREGSMSAPRVVARGADEVAARIKAIAQESSIPIIEAPPLARAIYANADVGDSVPEPLYSAIARVLAYSFALKKYRIVGGSEPILQEIEFPEELDPNNLKKT